MSRPAIAPRELGERVAEIVGMPGMRLAENRGELGREIIARLADLGITLARLPRLPAWSFQPEADAPALYLMCETAAQRDAIIRALGGDPEAALAAARPGAAAA